MAALSILPPGGFLFATTYALKQSTEKFDAHLVGPEAVVEQLVEPVSEQLARFVVPSGAHGVVVQLDDRRQVVDRLHLVRRGHGIEVVPQPAVNTLFVSQPVVGILPDNRVQVVAPAPLRR